MNKLITGEDIVRCFKTAEKRQIVLDHVSVSIDKGEFVSVMGPSGSGKSTLMYALSGMDEIQDGKVLFEDQELSKLKEDALADLRRTQMGFVFQQPHLLKNLNVLDNIILPAMHDLKGQKELCIKRAKSLMKTCGISELEEREITQVSGGQLQRAGICRALMSEPKIIFGDEPTGALNSKSAEEIMSLFSKINAQGTTIMLVTHDAKVAAQSERVLFMQDGKIVSELKLKKYTGKGLEVRTKKVIEQMQGLGV
ncbi:MAG: ABC transporter ATP-binding protein [Cellulosilyticum sp.]|nr:ABC transporter ATP-binding protein [Cellulosilyticum sp.]